MLLFSFIDLIFDICIHCSQQSNKLINWPIGTSSRKSMQNLLERYLIFLVFAIGCWIINLVQFFNCDFNPVGKEEILHGVGVFVPPFSVISVWF